MRAGGVQSSFQTPGGPLVALLRRALREIDGKGPRGPNDRLGSP